MALPKRQQITADWLIVGEGDGDDAFFRYLCQVRNIDGFQIEHVSGNADFENFLKGLDGWTGINRLKGLLVVADNDETPDASFANVRGQIGRAHLPQPNNSLQKANRKDGKLFQYAVAVLMLPYPRIGADSHGCLETLLLPAVERNLPDHRNCIEAYCECIFACGRQWTRTAKDKMHLRCLLSGLSNGDPNIALKHALRPATALIPLNDQVFDPIATLLSRFGEWLASEHQGWEDFLHAPNAAGQ